MIESLYLNTQQAATAAVLSKREWHLICPNNWLIFSSQLKITLFPSWCNDQILDFDDAHFYNNLMNILMIFK